MPSQPGQQSALHRMLEAELRGRISSGRWRAGTSLPSEAALSSEFGVSRGTVRQALTALRDDGLVFGGRGRRPTVRSGAKSLPFPTGLSFMQWAASQNLSPGERTLETAHREASAEACCALGLPDGSIVVDVLRLWSLDGDPALLERSSFVLDVGRFLVAFDAGAEAIVDFLAARGVFLDRVLHTVDAVAASTADAQLLAVDTGAPLLRERRTAFDAGGRPVGYSDNRYLPTLTNFTHESRLRVAAGLARPRG